MRGLVFLITGTPGSGKSTLSHALLQRFPRGLHLPVDDLRDFVVSGIAHPIPTWTSETTVQFRLARECAAHTALRYADAGFAVAIDDVLVLAHDEAPFAHLDAIKILLHPTVDVTQRPNATRTNKPFDTAILTDAIMHIHRAFAEGDHTSRGWYKIDSSHMTIEQLVDAACNFAQNGSALRSDGGKKRHQ